VTLPTALPGPRTPDPRAAPSLRWGILGTGWIAQRFTDTVLRNTTQRVVAVGSRDPERGAAFARDHGIARTHVGDEALVTDPEVDVVYVASPHHLHRDHALLAIAAGKHVLVEKPIGLHEGDARAIADAARAAGVFCAEALWTLFLPRYDVVRQVLAEGVLGEVHTALLDHGEWFPPEHRIHRPELAGGCLLDLAAYTVAVAFDVLGPATASRAIAEIGPTGVETQVSATVQHAAGAQSVHHSTIVADTPVVAVIAGERARLTLEPPFFGPGSLRLTGRAGSGEVVRPEANTRHEGLFWQAAEVARCIGDGARETALRPLEASVQCMRLLDDLRAEAGVASAA
jgi:predicted dehydrogenase